MGKKWLSISLPCSPLFVWDKNWCCLCVCYCVIAMLQCWLGRLWMSKLKSAFVRMFCCMREEGKRKGENCWVSLSSWPKVVFEVDVRQLKLAHKSREQRCSFLQLTRSTVHLHLCAYSSNACRDNKNQNRESKQIGYSRTRARTCSRTHVQLRGVIVCMVVRPRACVRLSELL